MERREFLKTAATGAAALGLAACASSPEKSESASAEPSGKMAQNFPGVGLLGYGCMRWPMVEGEDGVIDQEKVNALVDYALEHGVNYFDSAPVYLRGKSEQATATALQRHPREEYIIATKCSNSRGPFDFETGKKMYERSLEIYQTDYLDYYLLHNIDSAETFKKRFLDNGLMDFFLRERELGHIRNLGFSFHGGAEGFDSLMALHEKYHWDFVQIQMNYMDWTHAGSWNTNADYLYAELDKREIPVVIMEPLLGGRLSSIPAALSDVLKARRPSDSIASWTFRFCGSFPRVLTVLSGMTYMEHLQDNLRTYMNFEPVSEEEKAELERIADLMDRYPLVHCTDCQYCMPCPYGIDIPGLFKFYNASVNEGTYVTGKEQEGYSRARRRYLLNYDKSVESVRQADHCIGCRKCVPLCPQHIDIPHEIHKLDRYIESLREEKL